MDILFPMVSWLVSEGVSIKILLRIMRREKIRVGENGFIVLKDKNSTTKDFVFQGPSTDEIIV